MSVLTPSDVHIDEALSNVSVAFMQSAEGFVSNKVFPIIPVSKQSDKYWVYNLGDWTRNHVKPRAPATESAGAGFRLSTDSYLCEVYAEHSDLDNQTTGNADENFNLQMDTTEFLTRQELINREVKWQAAYFKTGVWDADVNVSATTSFGSAVFTSSSSTPIKGFRTAATTQMLKTGYKPNTLVLAKRTWDAIQDNDDFLARIVGGANTSVVAKVQLEQLAKLLELDRVLVMEAIQNTAALGATDSHAFVGTEGALLCYVPPRPGKKVASAGYTFVWSGLNQGANVDGVVIDVFEMRHLKAVRVEFETAFDHKLVSSLMGTFFYNTI